MASVSSPYSASKRQILHSSSYFITLLWLAFAIIIIHFFSERTFCMASVSSPDALPISYTYPSFGRPPGILHSRRVTGKCQDCEVSMRSPDHPVKGPL
jgi:hypothetical protein